MKYFILLSLFTLIACDVPSQRRQIFQSGKSNNVGDKLKPGNLVDSETGVPNSPTNGTSTATSGTGFESCSLSPKGSTVALGAIGICKNSVDPTQIKFQTSATDAVSRTCIIPTYKSSNGSSTYLGDPQCTFTQAGKIYLGRLYLTRQGFQGYPLTGVIIMKEPVLASYYECMHSYVFYTQNYNCTSSADYQACFQQYRYTTTTAHQMCCQRQATNYQALVCNTFKSNFAGQYIDIAL